MKKTKRFLGFLLMAAMLMSSICVSATDSAEATLSPYSTAETVDETNPKWGMKRDNNAAYMFSVDNTNFTLLEAAEDGSDFLVLADGARNSPSSIIPTGVTDPVTSMDPAKNSYLPTFLNSSYLEFEDDTKWTYYPTGQTNLWIYGLGKKVADYVNRDALWKTEKSAAGNEYVFKAAVTLPSVSEIYKYRDKIGYNHGARYSVWGTRTAVMAETESNAPNMVAFVPNGAACSTNVTGYTMSSAISLRPIFRLKREFFTKTNILHKKPTDATLISRLADMGSEVKKMLVANFKRSELTGVYDDAELTEIGFGFSENAPKITNIQVKTNIAAPGGTATLSYTSTPTSDENIVTWYIADDAEGTNPVKIDGASGAELTIPSSAGGMYLMAGITPILDDEIGSIVYSQPIPIEATLSTYSTAEEVSGTAWGMEKDNNRDYMFSVNKTNFTLLEAAEDGSDFLVLVDPAYVSAASRIISKTETKAIASMDPLKNSYLPSFLNTTYLNIESDDKTAAYQYGDESCNIKGLPTGVAQYVNRDALWRTEKSAAGDEYVFKAAVTLPSVSEIYKHRDKIGYNNNAVFTIWGTRTAVWASTASDTPNMVTFTPYNDTWWTNVSGNMQTNIYLRPILRLKREFFMNKNVLYKLNTTETALSDRLADMGAKVKEMLVANFARSELKGVYSDEELTAIGFSDDEPEISNVAAQGIASVAQTLTAGFEYSDPKGSALKSAEYQWYSADSADGTLSKIDGATDKTYKVTPDMLGKYIAVSVKVCNSDDAKSTTVFSPLAGPIAEREEVIVTPISISNTGAEFSVDNAKTGAADMVILYCVYDKTTNALVHITPVPISAPTGESRQSVTLTDYTAPDDCKVKAMVWDGLNTIVPYAMIEK